MSFINPFVFDETKSFNENLGVAAKFMRASGEANEGLAKWMLSTARPFNNPEFGIVAADEWKASLETRISIFLTQSMEICGFAVDASMFRLSGNTKFANYFKRIDSAMRHGGDLTQLLSVSACEKYTKEVKAKIKDDGEAAAKREQLKVMAERKGLVAGTPEFEAYVAAGMGERVTSVPSSLADSGQGDRADLGEPVDEWDELGRMLADQAREFAKEVSRTQAKDMINSVMKRMKDQIVTRMATKNLANANKAS
jgi:hypothetical protein